MVKSYVPGSYEAMCGATNPYYSLAELQDLADYVKFRLFGTETDVASEDAYDPQLRNFVGKLTTLQFIPAAVDFWGRQLLQETTTGTNETVMYPDRRNDGLWKIFDRLRAEALGEYDELAATYGFKVSSKGDIPAVSYGDNGRKDKFGWPILRTTDPEDFLLVGVRKYGRSFP